MIIGGLAIKNWLTKNAKDSSQRLLIASAYIKVGALKALIENSCVDALEKKLFVRWELEDLLSGASDLSVYELCVENGWQLYVNNSLHAKAYLFDNCCLVGSANLTNRGTGGIPPVSNIELCYSSDSAQQLSGWFARLESSSTRVTSDIYDKYHKLLQEHSDKFLLKKYQAPPLNFVSDTFSQQEGFFVKELFWSNVSSDTDAKDLSHDLSLLGLYDLDNHDETRLAFVQSQVFTWLLKMVDKQMYYGELTKILHDALLDDPAPYRKDVKMLLSNILSWVERYGGDFFTLDKPNHSTRLSRNQN